MHAIKALANIGDTIPFTTSRGVSITLQWVREGVYSVTVYNGSLRLDDLCASYPTEEVARLVARGYAILYSAEAEMRDAAEALKVDITDALAKAMRRRDTRRVAQLNRLADRLSTPAETALLEDVRNHLTAVHNGGAQLPARSFREIKARHAAALAADRKPAA